MIELKNISKIYKGDGIETVALTDINMTINKGDFVALMGTSGSGKTTLLNLIGLLDTATNGDLFIDGVNVTHASERERIKLRCGRIGFVFQSFNLIDELNVLENVALPLKYMGVGRSERNRKALDVLRNLKISHRVEYYPHQLSGGQQQLVAIARALVVSPELILADEPTGNLDSSTGKMIMETLTDINHKMGATVVIATHNRRDAEYAHRVLGISDGTIVLTEEFI